MSEKITALTPIEPFVTKEVPTFTTHEDIKTIERDIVTKPEKYKDVNHIFITDKEGRLIGAISLHKLLKLDYTQRLWDNISKDIKHITVATPLERAVSMALHHDITDLPVIDRSGKFVGILTAETLLRMAARLFSGKSYRHGGIVHEKIYQLVLTGSIPDLVIARIPWLVIGLLGGILSARFLALFEGVISENVVLALFIPAIVYMGGAINIQTETLFIRTLAIREGIDVIKYTIKDFFVTTIIGMFLGSILAAIGYIWKRDTDIAFSLGFTMILISAVSSVVAISIPTLLRKLGKDPALGTGPLATIIQDLISLVIYFMIATTVLK